MGDRERDSLKEAEYPDASSGRWKWPCFKSHDGTWRRKTPDVNLRSPCAHTHMNMNTQTTHTYNTGLYMQKKESWPLLLSLIFLCHLLVAEFYDNFYMIALICIRFPFYFISLCCCLWSLISFPKKKKNSSYFLKSILAAFLMVSFFKKQGINYSLVSFWKLNRPHSDFFFSVPPGLCCHLVLFLSCHLGFKTVREGNRYWMFFLREGKTCLFWEKMF